MMSDNSTWNKSEEHQNMQVEYIMIYFNDKFLLTVIHSETTEWHDILKVTQEVARGSFVYATADEAVAYRNSH